MMLTATKQAEGLGNRTNVNVRDGNDITYTVDDLTNRYTSIEDANLSYDEAGNLTTDKDSYEYEYDYENRIVKITKDGNDIAEFAYDALGRRIRKVDSVAGQTTYYYNNYKWQVLYETGDTGIKVFVYGNYIDEVLYRVPFFYYIHDHLYSTVAMVSWTGAVLERYEYDAYGSPTIWNADFTTERENSNYGNPYLFTGRRMDILDSGDLQIMSRYYDPGTGRFLSHDPLSYKDGMNLYEYVRSNPIIFGDPYGHEPVTILVCGGAVTLTAAEAAAAAFGVSVATCMVIPECRALIFEGTAKAIVHALKSVASAAKTACNIRCRFMNHKVPHHPFIRPRLGIPPWKKCWMKHIQITCYIKGASHSDRSLRFGYGPCYKHKFGLGGITH